MIYSLHCCFRLHLDKLEQAKDSIYCPSLFIPQAFSYKIPQNTCIENVYKKKEQALRHAAMKVHSEYVNV